VVDASLAAILRSIAEGLERDRKQEREARWPGSMVAALAASADWAPPVETMTAT